MQTALHYLPTCAFVCLCSHQADFIQGLLKKILNNSRICDFGASIYIVELEIKDTTDTARCASYLDLYLKIDSDCRLRTKLYNKRNDFDFPIVNFPFISSNISTAHAYGIFISQLIRYFREYGSHHDLLEETEPSSPSAKSEKASNDKVCVTPL